jgi:hypothetical protein
MVEDTLCTSTQRPKIAVVPVGPQQRLALADLSEDDLLTTRTFLGWRNPVVNRHGMKVVFIPPFLMLHGYPFGMSLILTRNPVVQLQICAATNQRQNDIWEILEHMELTGPSIGFSKIVTGTMHLSFGRRDGSYHAQTPSFYQALLDNARQVPVILQDIEHGRACYLDGQRFIFGVIQHRTPSCRHQASVALQRLFWACFSYDQNGPCRIWQPETARERQQVEKEIAEFNEIKKITVLWPMRLYLTVRTAKCLRC